MGKTTGNEELSLIFLAEFYHDMLAERRTATPDVNSHVKDAALDDAYQFGLRELTFLIVKATQDAIAGFGFIVLYEVYRSNVGIKLTLLPTLEKIASTVSKHAWFYDINALDGCLLVFHFLNINSFQAAKIQFFFVIRLPIPQKFCNFALVIELERHIEVLLLDNDCVIVPDFGGFVTHYISASYNEEDYIFLPPQRTLGFNPQLQINDSLLAQSYVNAYDISYPEALRRIESEVNELREILRTKGEYLLEDIGTLTVNNEGSYVFTPIEAGVLSPELYGLEGTTMMRLKDKHYDAVANTQSIANTRPVANTQPVPNSQTTNDQTDLPDNGPALLDFTDKPDDDRAIEIKLSWIRNAVAIAAAVVVFFLTATPIANSNLDTRAMSQLRSSISTLSMPKDSSVAPAIVAQKEAADSVKQEVAQDSIAAPQPVTPTYCIVLASQVKKSNAENYVSKLHEKGYTDARVYEHNRIVRVVFGNYATEGEAYQQLNKLSGTEEFAEAWVYKIKA